MSWISYHRANILIDRHMKDTIIRHPKILNLRRLSILPSWPYASALAPPARLFKFGIQLVPAPPPPPVGPLCVRGNDDQGYDDQEDLDDEREEDVKRLECFTLGLPLELATNEVSRQHLRLLRPRRLEITLVLQHNPRLMAELAELLSDKISTLSIRYLASERGMDLPDPADLVSPTMDRFRAVDIHLPALTAPSPAPHIIPHTRYQGQQDPYTSFSQHFVHLITADGGKRKRYAVWVEGEAPAMGPFAQGTIRPEDRVVWEREGDAAWSVSDERIANSATSGGTGKGKARDDGPDDHGSDHWERETNLKLLGGLLSLRLESKKH